MGNGQFYPAVIEACKDGLYSLLYDDGGKEDGVVEEMIKKDDGSIKRAPVSTETGKIS